MDTMAHMTEYGHEMLVAFSEPSAGLKAFVAVHDTTLGPACGGVRMWPHAYGGGRRQRCAAALSRHDLQVRGSRAIPRRRKGAHLGRPAHRQVRGAVAGVRTLPGQPCGALRDDGGRRGWFRADIEPIAQETRHVVGLPLSMGGSGDTSILTGLGIYLGMKAAAEAVWGSGDLEGRVVALQGFGRVGQKTAAHLLEEGVRLVVTDVYEDVRERAAELGAETVMPDEIYDVECDVFSPCALGGVLNGDTIPRLKCAIVAGGREQPAPGRRAGRRAAQAGHSLRSRLRHQRGRHHQRRRRDRGRVQGGARPRDDGADIRDDRAGA